MLARLRLRGWSSTPIEGVRRDHLRLGIKCGIEFQGCCVSSQTVGKGLTR